MKQEGDKSMAFFMTLLNLFQTVIWSGCGLGFLIILSALKDTDPFGWLAAGVLAGLMTFVLFLKNLSQVRLDNDLRDNSIRSQDSGTGE